MQPAPMSVPPNLQPMTLMVSTFLDGLAGGARGMFGTDLALRVVRVLARCEEVRIAASLAVGA